MGYDPAGFFSLGGFLIGLGVAAAGVGLLALTIATAGAATPLLAAGISTLGTAVSVGLIETGTAVAAAAATDSAAVIDVSVTDDSTNLKTGCSVVIDFGNDSAEFYSHKGTTTSSGYAVSYGAGVVQNYDSPGDYGGDFVDLSTSTKVKGVDYGIDICFAPSILGGGEGTSAIMGTIGFSLPSFNNTYDIAVGYDYYTPFAIIGW